MDNKANTSYSLKILTGIIVTVTAIGVTRYLLNERRNSEATLQRDHKRVADYNSAIDTPETNRAFLNKALRMREEWKTWVTQHRDLTNQLCKHAPPAQDTLNTIMAAIPQLPSQAACGIPLEEVAANSPLPFSWQALSGRESPVHPIEPSVRDKMKRGEDALVAVRVRDFNLYHDICLSRSVKTGGHRYSLWVSGRVTEQVLNTVTNSKASGNEGTENEMAPPL